MPRILVVDDDPAIQTTIRLILERAGYTVVVAGDGRQGVTLFERDRFDLVFLDIFMPRMDGLETLRAIRERQRNVPVIVISGRLATSDASGQPDYLAMAVKLGAVSSLSKPFRPADLLAAVATGLAGPQPSSPTATCDAPTGT